MSKLTDKEKAILKAFSGKSSSESEQAQAWSVVFDKLSDLPEYEETDAASLPGVIHALRIIDLLVEKARK